MSSPYKIGDLAREFGVTLRTLRFYEDKGLIHPDRDGATRLYSEEDRERLRIALFGKRIGLSLSEIREVLALHDRDNHGAQDEMLTIYNDQLSVLRGRLNETQRTIAELEARVEALRSAKH